jgi:hypothetical protein
LANSKPEIIRETKKVRDVRSDERNADYDVVVVGFGVLAETGIGISGLYAAGRRAVGLCSNSYVSGLALADCVFSGRRTAEHAATNPAARGEAVGH